MKKKIKQFMNIYVISSLIAAFSVLYLISFAFIDSNISKGSSVEIKKAMIEKQKMQNH